MSPSPSKLLRYIFLAIRDRRNGNTSLFEWGDTGTTY